ncbi:MAG: hypothetical protein NTV07_03315, partial [Candidatus Omnitrophica bacterium]|nr:hypothetical protein [Candidatus Omnitrophota bacterium]
MSKNIMSSGTDILTVNNKNVVLFAFLAAIILNVVPMEIVGPFLILLIGLAIGVLLISLFAPENFSFLINFYIIALGTRALLSFLFYLASFIAANNNTPGFFFSNDGWCYSQQGWQICQFAERGIRIV